MCVWGEVVIMPWTVDALVLGAGAETGDRGACVMTCVSESV